MQPIRKEGTEKGRGTERGEKDEEDVRGGQMERESGGAGGGNGKRKSGEKLRRV